MILNPETGVNGTVNITYAQHTGNLVSGSFTAYNAAKKVTPS